MSYQIFKFYGFQTLLTEKERKELLGLNPHENEKLDEKIEKLYSKYHKEFENIKRQILDIIEYCLLNEKRRIYKMVRKRIM